jgi:protein MAK11
MWKISSTAEFAAAFFSCSSINNYANSRFQPLVANITMAKRKRTAVESAAAAAPSNSIKKSKGDAVRGKLANSASTTKNPTTIQIITGSYERVLHGIVATIAPTALDSKNTVEFTDSFLFNAHTSAIRCLALSLPSPSKDKSQSQKVILATGSTDERINLYHLSLSPPPIFKGPAMPTLSGNNSITENPQNRELGSLLHHTSTINSLYFPTRTKLLSASEDNTIGITRTRDWTLLSTIKAPVPKAQGRPSGDTAPHGGTPAGVHDFAVHPSMKLMVTVGKGEKCMRLWNLVTGKKAGVLNFGREVLAGVGEGRWGSGEGRRVLWSEGGEEFAVGFERGAVVFGMVSRSQC